MKKYTVLLIELAIILALLGGIYVIPKIQSRFFFKESVPRAIPVMDIIEDREATAEILIKDLPEELNLSVPFYSQAPFGNWDYPWQEACEEASVLLVANAYYRHDWTREEFNKEILKLVEWEKNRFGQYEHTNNEETAQMLKEYLGLDYVIHKDPSLSDVKMVLAKGHLIVMTFSGRELGNPFYTGLGPVYHAMVIKGYKKDDKLIVHDVGTRKGEDYVYSWNTIYNALRDYAEPIQAGGKYMIEVIPPK